MTIEGRAIGGADLDVAAHRRCSVLLRRWLSETHTAVAAGPLDLVIGAVRISTEITYESITGAHGFGPIRVPGLAAEPGGDRGDRSEVDPLLLAEAMSAGARARAPADAPINGAEAPTLADAMARAHAIPGRELDPLAGHAGDGSVRPLVAQHADGVPPLIATITGPAAAHRWLAEHVETVLLPALRSTDAAANPGDLVLTRATLTAIGLFGRHGVADERSLVDELASRLCEIAESRSQPARVRAAARSWSTSPTLTDVAALNGSGLRYRRALDRTQPITVDPVHYQTPNPLHRALAPGGEAVPGPPVPELGHGWHLRPVELDESGGGADVDLVHAWMHTPHVARTWEQAWSWERWREELAKQLGGGHSVPCVVSRDGRQLAYVEIYRVSRDVLARTYPYDEHDLGVHIAIGEPGATGRGAGSSLLRAVAEALLDADPGCRRVVAEPDVHNAASVAAFGKAGFVREGEVGLPGKNAALMVFAR